MTAQTTVHAALWTRGGLLDLGVPPGKTDAAAQGINDSATVVATAWGRSPAGRPDPLSYRAFLRRAGQWQAVPMPPGSTRAYAQTVTNTGHVLGSAVDSSGRRVGFVWDGSGAGGLQTIRDPHGQHVEVAAVNDAGVVVGATLPVGQAGPKAFVWQAGRMRELFPTRAVAASEATGISARGEIVGALAYADRKGLLAFTLPPVRPGERAPRPIVARRPGPYAAVNARGTRVGSDGGLRAYAETSAGLTRLLPPSGFDQPRPVAVNNRGVVAGTASLPNPVRHDHAVGADTRAVVWDSTGAVRVLPLIPPGCAPAR